MAPVKTQTGLLLVLALTLASCAGESAVSTVELPGGTATIPALSRCNLLELETESNGSRTRDPEFERSNHAMQWQFAIEKNILRSQRQIPGNKATVFEVPIVSVSREAIVAEGPVPEEIGRMHMRVEVSRTVASDGKYRVLQKRTWKMANHSVTTLMPFHGWSTHLVTWKLACDGPL